MSFTNLQAKLTTKEVGNKYSGKKVDVLFFQPVRKEGAWLFSNALLQLASFLHLHGFKAKVVHFGISQNYKETVKEAILKYNPRFLAVGLRWFPNLYIALQAIRFAKTVNKNIITIMGGHTASFFDKEIMEANPFVDFIIKGDAEFPLLSIIQGKEPINCTYRDGKRAVRKSIEYTQTKTDLEGLHLVDLKTISDNIYGINYMQLNR